MQDRGMRGEEAIWDPFEAGRGAWKLYSLTPEERGEAQAARRW